MRIAVVVLLAIHGCIHVMGFAKAFGYDSRPQLKQPISRGMGLLWLSGAVLVIGSAVMLAIWPRSWWVLGAVALVISQAVIMTAWRDAWAGTIVNVVLLAAVTHGWLTEGPASFRAQFERDVASRLVAAPAAPVITEQDLARVPEPARQYLRATGFVGQPQIHNFRLRFRGRIRSGPGARWMPFDADQYPFVDQPTRLFLMRARLYGLPVEAFHRFLDGRATMKVKIAGAVTIVDASGPVMDRSETVTFFNDMSLLAPGTLLDSRIVWEPIDRHSVNARFTNGSQSITATLLFGDDGLLVNFVSEDRSRALSDGKTFSRVRFLTPVRDYRSFGRVRLPALGEARWLLPDGEFTYGEFELEEIAHNVRQ